MQKSLRQFLSLGVGVQSSTLLLMSLHGDLPRLDAVAFADTGDEPSWVYEQLALLRNECARLGGPEIATVSAGHLGSLMFEYGKARPPFFVDRGGQRAGKLWRKCTREMKIRPLERYWKRQLGLRKGARLPQNPICDIWLGISMDEMQRASCHPQHWAVNVFPLLEKRMRREDCLTWLASHGYPALGKSACVYCPYRSNAEWREMYTNHPEDFSRAVAYDNALRERPEHLSSFPVYVHRSLKPLETLPFLRGDTAQLDMFCPTCMT